MSRNHCTSCYGAAGLRDKNTEREKSISQFVVFDILVGFCGITKKEMSVVQRDREIFIARYKCVELRTLEVLMQS